MNKQLFSVFCGDSSDISVERIFTFLFDELPNIYSINFAINLQELLEKLKETYSLTSNNFLLRLEESCKEDWLKVNYNKSAYLIKIKKQLLVFISSTKTEIYYGSKITQQDVKELIKLLKTQAKAAKRQRFFLLNYEDGDFYIKPFETQIPDIDLSLFFNDDIIEFDQKVKEFINNNKISGIVILYGKPGTGKTLYLKHLFNATDKKFLIIPKKLFGALETPNFYFYISELHDFVVIMENCQNLLNNGLQSSPIYEFLNNAEGIFANDFKYKIICTLSAQEHQINFQLISKANLILTYELKPLSVEKAAKLREKFNLQGSITQPMPLSQVLNPQIATKTRKLGFKN